MMRRLRWLQLAVLALAAGCSSSGFNRPVELPPPETHRTPSGATYEEVHEGLGAPAAFGSLVRIHYVGWIEGGAQFDSSLARGVPLAFTIGKHEVPKGLEEGLLGMRVGGKRLLHVPADLAYGAEGVEGLVPPNSNLRFEIDLLESAGP